MLLVLARATTHVPRLPLPALSPALTREQLPALLLALALASVWERARVLVPVLVQVLALMTRRARPRNPPRAGAVSRVSFE